MRTRHPIVGAWIHVDGMGEAVYTVWPSGCVNGCFRSDGPSDPKTWTRGSTCSGDMLLDLKGRTAHMTPLVAVLECGISAVGEHEVQSDSTRSEGSLTEATGPTCLRSLVEAGAVFGVTSVVVQDCTGGGRCPRWGASRYGM